jgi:hypothetical protein
MRENARPEVDNRLPIGWIDPAVCSVVKTLHAQMDA